MAKIQQAAMAIVMGGAAAVATPSLAFAAKPGNLITLVADDESPKELAAIGNLSIGVDFSPNASLTAPPPTTLDISNPAMPMFTNLYTGGSFHLSLFVHGIGTGSTLRLPAAPTPATMNTVMVEDVITNGMTLSLFLDFGGTDPTGWASFTPPADPTADVLGIDITYPGVDPTITFYATLNDGPLTFTAPEPENWAAMLLGLGGLAAAASQRPAKRARSG